MDLVKRGGDPGSMAFNRVPAEKYVSLQNSFYPRLPIDIQPISRVETLPQWPVTGTDGADNDVRESKSTSLHGVLIVTVPSLSCVN